MKKIVFVFLTILLTFCLVSCGSTVDEVSGGGTFDDDLTLVGEPVMTVDYDDYLGWSVEITGTLKNTSGQDLSYANIEFTLYDADGVTIDTAYDYISGIREGETWRFKATNLWVDEKPVSFSLLEIDCW